ncbi:MULTISPECIES: DUF3613 domain-containing protein [Pandoraea]|uniref:DUF3613 domain-containing protein n=1 Tax=Pandoraea cepalis TaxID=2508294 RepID=A0A5E4U5N7_9BURK|nr:MULTISPECIES: DUF3613 domain-containing protein [Pandoraea]VVD94368.1 hypothetical protein PCE31107_01800 [Pandoraea cepalis]
MMAGQKPHGTLDAGPRRATRLVAAALALWAGAVAAQLNAPITGSMGGADARNVAAPAPAPAPVVSATPAAQTAAAPVEQTRRVPHNVVRRDTALRVGEHARDGMLGDETEALLALQAGNLAAGPGLPMLGSTASRAYKRYLDSFTYPIPQFYPAIVQGDTGTGNNGGGSAGAAPAAAGAGASQ